MNNTYAILFRLLNFGALFGLIFYAFKKSLLPQLQSFMKKKAAASATLDRNHATLLHHYENIQTTIAQEHSLIEQLKMNITIWQKIQAVHRQMREQNSIERAAAMEKKAAQQATINALAAFKKQTIPAAVDHAQEQAKNYYHQSDHQQKYLESILASLKKGAP